MKRFFHIAALFLATLLLTACPEIKPGPDEPDIPGGPDESWRNQASTEKLSGITYQINVYSFADSDGDGWGDIRTSRSTSIISTASEPPRSGSRRSTRPCRTTATM